MGAELSKLRGGDTRQREAQRPTNEASTESELTNSNTLVSKEKHESSLVTSTPNQDSGSLEIEPGKQKHAQSSDQVFKSEDIDQSSAVQSAAAAEPSEKGSLEHYREHVQSLRAEATDDNEDLALRKELESAGMLSTGNYDDSQDTATTDSDSSLSESESDEETVNHPNEVEENSTDLVAPVTKNEVVNEEIPMPSISQVSTEDLALLQHIGKVHSIVDNVILVAQTEEPTDGEPTQPRKFDVLDSGSLLTLENGHVLGLVYETFGSVKEPFYSIRLPSADMIDREAVVPNIPVYYLPTSSTYVLARAIHTKGSDASNIWDEEVAEDEAEYSDDEEEAAAKRRAKQARQGRDLNSNDAPLSDIDPMEASLGPLGGYAAGDGPAARGRKRKDKGRRGRGGFHGESKRGRTHTFGQMPSAPHINPRFAGQWMHPGSPFGMPLMPPFPPSFGMPPMEPYRPDAFGAYSPNHAQLDPAQSGSYDPRAPNLSSASTQQSYDTYTPQ